MDEPALHNDGRAGAHGFESLFYSRLVDTSGTLNFDDGKAALFQVIDVLALVREPPLYQDLEQWVVRLRPLELAADDREI
jgi:hypothetical protein